MPKGHRLTPPQSADAGREYLGAQTWCVAYEHRDHGRSGGEGGRDLAPDPVPPQIQEAAPVCASLEPAVSNHHKQDRAALNCGKERLVERCTGHDGFAIQKYRLVAEVPGEF